MKTSSPRKAFTLVELLVVIAVIAILIGLLAPALGRAKERAAQLRSIANASQIVKGIFLYATDNGNTLPNVGVDELDEAPTGSEKVVMDYLKDQRVFQSPRDKGTTYGAMASSSSCYNDKGTSYAYAAAAVSGIASVKGKKLTSVTNSSAKVVVFEPIIATDQSDEIDQWYSSPSSGGVVGFLDGHAERVNESSSDFDADNIY